jgi:hypothetical protein
MSFRMTVPAAWPHHISCCKDIASDPSMHAAAYHPAPATGQPYARLKRTGKSGLAAKQGRSSTHLGDQHLFLQPLVVTYHTLTPAQQALQGGPCLSPVGTPHTLLFSRTAGTMLVMLVG